jgi:alkylation response protein AidB-like acyl-CoA dehydrogenase
MTKMTKGKAAIAAGIGSAAIAAAVMYANHRKDKKKKKAEDAPVPPIVDPPETD